MRQSKQETQREKNVYVTTTKFTWQHS